MNTIKFERDHEYGIEEVEAQFPHRIMIAFYGSGSMLSELYYLPAEQKYIVKGAYGTHDSICYKLANFNDEAGKERWIRENEDYWNSIKS